MALFVHWNTVSTTHTHIASCTVRDLYCLCNPIIPYYTASHLSPTTPVTHHTCHTLHLSPTTPVTLCTFTHHTCHTLHLSPTTPVTTTPVPTTPVILCTCHPPHLSPPHTFHLQDLPPSTPITLHTYHPPHLPPFTPITLHTYHPPHLSPSHKQCYSSIIQTPDCSL